MKLIVKNFKTIMALLVVASLASCSQNSKLSVNKRHYRSGYEITWSGNKKTEAQVHNKTERTDIKPAGLLNITINEVNTEVSCIETYSPETFTTYTEPVVSKAKYPINLLHHDAAKSVLTNTKIETDYLPAESGKIIPAAEKRKQGFFKKLFSSSSEMPKWAEIILCIILPPLPVGLKFGIGSEFWISLLLTLLFWIPGVIYALIVCNK